MKRDRLIEMLRVVAAFLIIWYHARTIGSEFAYSGLVIFIILSMNFEAGENIDRKVDVIKLALRLLIPWVFWCLVYAILDFARRKPVLDFHNGVVGAILTGSSFHLWYLPFIFVVMVSFGLLKAKLASRVLTLGATALALAMIGLARLIHAGAENGLADVA